MADEHPNGRVPIQEASLSARRKIPSFSTGAQAPLGNMMMLCSRT